MPPAPLMVPTSRETGSTQVRSFPLDPTQSSPPAGAIVVGSKPTLTLATWPPVAASSSTIDPSGVPTHSDEPLMPIALGPGSRLMSYRPIVASDGGAGTGDGRCPVGDAVGPDGTGLAPDGFWRVARVPAA